MVDRTFYALLRVGFRVVPLLPTRALYALADIAGTLAFWLLPRVRTTVDRNFALAFPGWTSSERRGHVRCAFCHDAKNWIDTLRIPSVSDDALQQRVRVDGWHLLEEAAAAGRGGIIVTMHLGNFDLVGQLLAARGWKLTVPVERMRDQRVFELLVRARASRGIQIVPVEDAPRAMVRALARGEFVGLAIDRVVAGKTITVPFFGRETAFARGFASLVKYADVPVFIGVGVRDGRGGFDAHVLGPLRVQRGPGPETEHANTQIVTHEMQRLIETFPDQWMAFWDMWPDDTVGAGTDTLVQRSEVVV